MGLEFSGLYTQGSPLRVQPWAIIRDPVGVELKFQVPSSMNGDHRVPTHRQAMVEPPGPLLIKIPGPYACASRFRMRITVPAVRIISVIATMPHSETVGTAGSKLRSMMPRYESKQHWLSSHFPSPCGSPAGHMVPKSSGPEKLFGEAGAQFVYVAS